MHISRIYQRGGNIYFVLNKKLPENSRFYGEVLRITEIESIRISKTKRSFIVPSDELENSLILWCKRVINNVLLIWG